MARAMPGCGVAAVAHRRFVAFETAPLVSGIVEPHKVRPVMEAYPNVPPADDDSGGLAQSGADAAADRDAEAHCRRILAKEPQHAATHYRLAALLSRRGDLDGALPHFITALRGDEGQPRYWLGVIVTLLSLDRLNEAKSVLTMFVGREFSGADAKPVLASLRDMLFAQADERRRANRIGDAELLYDAALMLDGTHAPSLHGAARVALACGRREDALILLDLAIAQDPSASYRIDLARLLCQGGHFADALTHAELALAQDATLLGAQAARLVALCGLGRMAEAMAFYRDATADDADRFRGTQELHALIRRVQIEDRAEREPAARAQRHRPSGFRAGRTSRNDVFYVSSPGYSYLSGGPLALHLLCHHLNELGYEAYMHTDVVQGDLRTPILTPAIKEAHVASRRRLIGVYPEIDHSNRLSCDRVIRYLLNTPGARSHHSGDDLSRFWHDGERRREYLIHYAEEFQVPYLKSHPLWLPIVDRSVYYRIPDARPRRGFLVYSHRVGVTPDMIPDWAHPYTVVSMANFRTPEELAELYRSSEGLIVFERTGAMSEAMLCGCPVVAVPNPMFEHIPMFSRVGNLGLGWGAGRDQFEWAQRSVEAVCNVYRAYDNAVPTEVGERIKAALDFFDAGEEWAS